MRTRSLISLITLISLAFGISTAIGQGRKPEEVPPDRAATVVDDAIWADGLLYGTAATTNQFFDPPLETLDKIYSFAESGLAGQRSVSEAKPGDTDYNGGRWWVQVVVFTPTGLDVHDPDMDGMVNFELTSAEEVLAHAALGHLMIYDPGVYFSCPLRGPGKSVE